ncbi:DUF2778 domain-containing protein [Pseudomonas sp.]|jgi:hypothetical protein|uniref:DUF2778 domain-containing protein n=1 Tax=Pseudomonas sp. TaxID=306 RepID=UPI002ED9220C
MAGKNERNPNIAYCTYVLNGEPLSELTCEGKTYEAFSGNSATYVNDSRYQDIVNSGPLPLGRYYILDRESGGMMGWIREPVKDLFARTNRSEWLSLYRDDGVVDDLTSVNNISRGAFRIHPVGPQRISQGCVTLNSELAFEELRTFIRNMPGEVLEGTSIKFYGVLEVLDKSSSKSR